MNVKTEGADDANAFDTDYVHAVEPLLTEWSGLHDEAAYCNLAEDAAPAKPVATGEKP